MSMRCPNTWQGVVLWSTILKKNRSGPESAGWMFACCLNRQRAIFLLHSCASVQLLCIYKLHKLSRTHYIHETKAFSWIPLHKKSGRIDQSRRAPRESEGCWEREREGENGRKKLKTRPDLWVSFQQSHPAALSPPEHKSWKRCGTQKHNSGFPLLCNDWWNND